MSESIPTLSICIPTYNRAAELRQCLDSIIKQLDQEPTLKSQVEVVIYDNASQDNTEEVSKEFKNKIPLFHYSKNNENLGFDKNVLKVVAASTGEYCLTLGDDDGIIEGGIRAILKVITETQSAYFNLNGWGYNHALTEPLRPYPGRQLPTDITFNTLREYVLTIKSPSTLVGTFGGMSVQLFKRQPWMDLPNKESFIGTQTIHLFVLLSAFKDLPCTLMKEPTIMTRNDNLRWDSFPGLESEQKRARKTAKTAVWINDLYGLNISPFKIKRHLQLRAGNIIIRGFIKKILFRMGLYK